MLDKYRAVLRVPGATAFCATGFLARMPIAIYPIGLLLLISTRTHHYGFAGLLSGAYILGGVPGNPLGARLVDRFGQHRVLLPAAAVQVASVAVLVVLVEGSAPDWVLLFPTFVVGLSFLAIGALTRARWSHVLTDETQVSTAYSLESILDEVIFVVGPLIATLLATQVNPVAPLVLSAGLIGVGSLALARLRSTEPPAHARGSEREPTALRHRGMVLIICVAAAMGAIFASVEVTAVAFAGQHGHQAAAGLVLAAFAAGSGLAGFAYGNRTWRAPLLSQFRRQALIFGALPCVLLLATNIPVLTVLTFVVGLGIAPTLITSFGLIAEIVPARALTEGLAWLVTGLNIGYGIAATLAGRTADAHGARTAYLITVVAGAALAGFALLVFARLRPPAATAMSAGRGTID